MFKNLFGNLRNLDQKCKEYFLGTDIDLTAICIGATVCLMPMTALLDYTYYGLSDAFFVSCAFYGLFAALSIIIIFIIRRNRNIKTYEISVFIWSMFAAISALIINFLQPDRIVENVLISELLLIAIYSLVTNRLSFRLITSITITIACVIALFATHNKASPQEKYLFTLMLLIINVVGLFIVSRNNRFKRIEQELRIREQETHRTLEMLAASDPLTGILNRRSFLEQTRLALERFRRYNLRFCLAIFDLDNLKQVNDLFGHLAGDEAIKLFTNLVISQIRLTDVFGRLGGDEFGFILLEATEANALKFIARIQGKLLDLTISSPKGNFILSFSAGVTEVEPDDKSPDDLIGRADEALYRSKAKK